MEPMDGSIDQATEGSAVRGTEGIPYSTTLFEEVGTYTWPLTTVGSANLDAFPRALTPVPEFQISFRVVASKARSNPGAGAAYEADETVSAHRIAVDVSVPAELYTSVAPG